MNLWNKVIRVRYKNMRYERIGFFLKIVSKKNNFTTLEKFNEL